MEILTGYQLFKNKNRLFFLLIFFFDKRRRTDTITKQLAYSTSSSAHSISRLILALHTISTNTHQKADIIYQTKFTHTFTFTMNIFSSALAAVLLASNTANAFTTTSSSSSSSSFSTKLQMSKIDGRTVDGGQVVPTNNFLLVKNVAVKEETEGGIFLTGKAKIQKTEGTVVKVGPGKTHPDTGAVFVMPVVEGDNVVYGEFDGTEIDIDGDKHTLIRDDDILIKFTGDELTLDSCSAVRDSILVYVETKETSTEGGILIASTKNTQNRPSTGKVVKVGPGRFATNGELMDMEIEEGDYVKFRDFAGNEIEINDEEYTVVHALDILAKF